jgi:hypothetical protein
MKKEVPLTILKMIEPVLPKLKSNNLFLEKNPNAVLKIVDLDIDSKFFFEISACEPNNSGGQNLQVKFKPQSESNVNEYSGRIEDKHFEHTFKRWLSTVEGYSSVKSLFDDPILKKYADDFYTEFESADEDATTASFNLKQQLLLDSALTQVIHVLEAKKVEGDKELIAALIEQAEEIQSTVTENTKQETLTKLSKFFAKIQKGGIKLIKDIYPIIQKEIIGAAIKNAAEHLPAILHSLSS